MRCWPHSLTASLLKALLQRVCVSPPAVPCLSVDHAGSFSPHQPMPYAFAIQAGLSDAGMMQVAVDQAEDGISLRGNGHANTKEVWASGGTPVMRTWSLPCPHLVPLPLPKRLHMVGHASPIEGMPQASTAPILSATALLPRSLQVVENGGWLVPSGLIPSWPSQSTLKSYSSFHSFQVVENAGQRGCVVLDLAEDKKTQLKSLPGLLLGGEKGGLKARLQLVDVLNYKAQFEAGWAHRRRAPPR